MQEDKNHVLFGGMHQDTAPMFQPENTYRFALNAIRNKREMESSLSNEPGTELCYTLTAGFFEIGSVYLQDGRRIVFSTNNTQSEIGLVENCTYTQILLSNDLNFSTSHPIQGLHKIKNGCEYIIYFNDYFNPDRVINIDDLEQYIKPGFSIGAPDPNMWDPTLMEIHYNHTIPTIELDELISGAGYQLPVGKYAFAIRYEDEQQNNTGWIEISQLMELYIDSPSLPVNLIGGDITGSFTNKAIKLHITNIDTRFPYYRLAVASYTAGDGFTPEVFQLERRDITGTEAFYTYDGTVDTSATIAPDELAAPPVRYKFSKVMREVDNRLLRAGLKNEQIDYTAFQAAANAINVLYEVRPSLAETTNFDSHYNSKSPWQYREQSYMRDEIYSLGIVYIFADGTESPAFHIPGRAAIGDDAALKAAGNGNTHYRNQVTGSDPWDKQELTVVLDTDVPTDSQIKESNVAHLGLSATDTLERWEVYNTAIRAQNYTFTNNQWSQIGYMGYYESTTRYPDIRDCNDVPIYPHTDLGGGNYQMDFIRHHRMPDTTLEPHITIDSQNPAPGFGNDLWQHHVGLNLQNIQLPAGYTSDQITGYRIVRGDRTSDNKTIIDKGFLEVTQEVSQIVGTSIWDGSPTENRTAYTSTMAFNAAETIPNPGFGTGGSTTIDSADEQQEVLTLNTPKDKFFNINIEGLHLKFECVQRDPSASTLSTRTATGASVTGDHYFHRYAMEARWRTDILTRDQTHRVPSDHTYLVRNSDSFVRVAGVNNVIGSFGEDTMLYVGISNYSKPLATTLPVADSAKFHYVSLKNNVQPYDSINDIRYINCHNGVIDISNTNSVVFGGDCYISDLRYTKSKSLTDESFRFWVPGTTDKNILHINTHMSMYVESDVNVGLRYVDENVTVPSVFSENDVLPAGFYYPRIGGTLSEWLYTDASAVNFFGNNRDFDATTNLRYYFPLPSSYDYCSDCRDEYPNRIIYSEVDTYEDNADAYRVYLANNYVDIPPTFGDIEDLILTTSKSLYALTESSAFRMFTNNQTLQTSGENIIVGNAAFLSLPPTQLFRVPQGYGGTQGKFNAVNTEYGTFYVDQFRSKVYMVNDSGIIPIRGLDSFLKKYLPSRADKEYKEHYGLDWPYMDNMIHPFGIGVFTQYDPINERLIIHKRDYEVIAGSPASITDPADLVTGDYIQRQDFTISLDLETKSWVSFHSYMPRVLSSDNETLYTSADGNAVYKHVERQFQTYYGTTYPHFVEIVLNNPNTFKIDTVSWVGEVFDWSDRNETWIQQFDSRTYDQMWVYNGNQSTGMRGLQIASHVDNPYNTWEENTKPVYWTDGVWSTNQIRNLMVSHASNVAISTRDRARTEFTDYFNGTQGWIDKAPIDELVTKVYHEQEMIRGKYVVVRLGYDPGFVTDFRFLLDYIKTRKTFAER